MFCMECGTKLPDNAKFCMNCGTPVGQTAAAPATPVTPKAAEVKPAAPKSEPVPVYGCSEKAGGMVYAPGKGLYFLADGDQKIMFLPEGQKKASVLVHKGKNYHEYRGLNYWKGSLYVYRDGDTDDGFLKVDVETGEKKLMKLTRSVYLPHSSRFMVKDGIGYFNYEGQLCEIKLETGSVMLRDLPDMRMRPLPDSWREVGCIDESRGEEFNYGETFAGFYLHGDFGYASVEGVSGLTVCFPLKQSHVQFDYMPADSCTAYQDLGMISTFGKWVLGNGNNSPKLYGTPMAEYHVMGEAKVLYPSLPSYQMEKWWRAGKRYIVGDRMVDFEAKKAKKLSFSVEADDFISCKDGSVYLYQSGKAIYHLPANFDMLIWSEDDLDAYRIYEED